MDCRDVIKRIETHFECQGDGCIEHVLCYCVPRHVYGSFHYFEYLLYHLI